MHCQFKPEHWHYDTFRAKFVAAGVTNAYVTFALNAQGKIETVTLNLPDLADYPFKREPATAATAAVSLSEEELKKFAGKYESKTPPVEVSVEIVGGKLKAVVPGQPVYTLVPVAANRFSIEGAPSGFFIQFEMVDNRVKSLTLIQGRAEPYFIAKAVIRVLHPVIPALRCLGTSLPRSVTGKRTSSSRR
jgi:hypothetical protein